MNNKHADTEQGLIRGFLGGDRWAFEKLMTLHQERIYRLALGMLGDHDRAADLTQETFIRAFRGLERFRFASSFGTWLHRIAVNLCLSQIRRDRLRQALSLGEVAQRLTSAHGRPERELQLKELGESIEMAIAKLPPKQRAVFLLRHYEDQSYAEIAAVMKRSEGTVRATYHQAIMKLRRILVVHDDEENQT